MEDIEILPLSIALSIDNADVRLDKGDETTARAIVTRNGSPQDGVVVTFTTADADLASVAPTTVQTGNDGKADAQVRGETSWWMTTTQVTATADGKSDTKPVKVPVLPAWAIAFLIALTAWFIVRR